MKKFNVTKFPLVCGRKRRTTYCTEATVGLEGDTLKITGVDDEGRRVEIVLNEEATQAATLAFLERRA